MLMAYSATHRAVHRIGHEGSSGRWWMLRALWLRMPTPLLVLAPCLLATVLTLPRLGARSLWLDELWVALDIRHGIFDPSAMASDQRTTPIGFLLLVAAIVHAASPTEFWFRVPAYLSGLGAIVAIFLLTQAMFRSRLAATLASLIMATNYAAISYFMELKPYATDMFLSTVILLAACRVITTDTRATWAAYGATLSLGPIFSLSSLFVEAGAVIAICYLSWSRGLLRTPRFLLAHAIPASCMVMYAALYLSKQRTAELLQEWTSGFPASYSVIGVLRWYRHQSQGLMHNFFMPLSFHITRDLDPSYVLTIAIEILLGYGIYTAFRERPSFALLLCSPYALATLAGLLRIYPFEGAVGDRVLLFLLPELTVLLAAAVAAILRAATTTGRLALAVVTLGVVLLPAAFTIVEDVRQPQQTAASTEDAGALIARDLYPNLRSYDALYVYYGAQPALQYYAPAIPIPHGHNAAGSGGYTVYYGLRYDRDPGPYVLEVMRDVAQPRFRRVWVLFSHLSDSRVEYAVTAALGSCFKRRESLRATGASLYLFDRDRAAQMCHDHRVAVAASRKK
jgi:hypothetical protein